MGFYNTIAKGYDQLHKDEQEAKIAKIIDVVDSDFLPKKGEKLLDVGCGTGVSTAPWECECVGIDPAEELVRIAEYKFRNDDSKGFVCAKAEEIPFPDNSFDFVLSVTAFQNFDDIRKAIKEIKRVGKNKFVFTVLKKSSKIDEIEKLIIINFRIKKIIMEAKDVIFVCESNIYKQ